jgi:hypothetical protein
MASYVYVLLYTVVAVVVTVFIYLGKDWLLGLEDGP